MNEETKKKLAAIVDNIQKQDDFFEQMDRLEEDPEARKHSARVAAQIKRETRFSPEAEEFLYRKRYTGCGVYRKAG